MSEEPKATSLISLKLVYTFCILSVFIYAGVFFMMKKTGTEMPGQMDAAQINILAPILGVLGLFEIIGAFVFRSRAAAAPGTEKQKMQRFFVASIVSWALCESVAIYGLILGLLTGNVSYFAPFAVASVVALIMLSPKQVL